MAGLYLCSLLKDVMYCTGAVSKTKASVSKNPYFPETVFVSYEQRNVQQMFGRQLNLHVEQVPYSD